jgi:hypothetical protein
MAEQFPAIYANFVRIIHGPLEFLVDFKRSTPEQPDPEQSDPLVRVILTPAIAKAFLKALAENIQNYESTFGELPTSTPPGPGTMVQ